MRVQSDDVVEIETALSEVCLSGNEILAASSENERNLFYGDQSSEEAIRKAVIFPLGFLRDSCQFWGKITVQRRNEIVYPLAEDL